LPENAKTAHIVSFRVCFFPFVQLFFFIALKRNDDFFSGSSMLLKKDSQAADRGKPADIIFNSNARIHYALKKMKNLNRSYERAAVS